MFFSRVYNVIFEVEEEIPRGTWTGYTQWFGEQKMNPERFLVVFMLNNFIQQGRFDGPGKYHFQAYRRWYSMFVHAHLAKFPLDATEESIRKLYEVLITMKEKKDNG